MVKKRKLIFYLLYYILAACFLLGFWGYLQKPSCEQWDRVVAVVRDRGAQSPILFSPSWLKNYATDFDRFNDLTFLSFYNRKPESFWTVSPRAISESGFSAVYSEKVGRLEVTRWVRLSSLVGESNK